MWEKAKKKTQKTTRETLTWLAKGVCPIHNIWLALFFEIPRWNLFEQNWHFQWRQWMAVWILHFLRVYSGVNGASGAHPDETSTNVATSSVKNFGMKPKLSNSTCERSGQNKTKKCLTSYCGEGACVILGCAVSNLIHRMDTGHSKTHISHVSASCHLSKKTALRRFLKWLATGSGGPLCPFIFSKVMHFATKNGNAEGQRRAKVPVLCLHANWPKSWNGFLCTVFSTLSSVSMVTPSPLAFLS